MTSRGKFAILLVAAILLALVPPAGRAGAAARTERIAWQTLAEGTDAAKSQGKPMVVDFYFPDGCDRCEKLEQYVYRNPALVSKLNADFIPIRIYLNRTLTPAEKALGERHNYNDDCLLLFLSPAGTLLGNPEGGDFCFTGYIEPNVFLRYLDSISPPNAEP